MRATPSALRGRLGGERGSVLVAAIALTFVLTLLGFALFDLALLESRLGLGTEADYRALELAHSALERALYRLLLDLCGPSGAACTSPPLNASWADGTIDTTSFGPTTGSNFAPFIGSTAALGGSFAGQGYAGTYSVDLRNITVTDAGTLGLTCSADLTNPSNCANLIYARATGNFRSGNVTSATRTIQIVVRGRFNGLGEGFVVGGPAVDQINGNTEIHGSLHFIPCGSAPSCNPLLLGGGASVRNNYNGLAAGLQNLIPLLPLVTCPPGTACAGNSVETLGASVRIAFPRTTAAIDIQSNAATIGESGSGATNSYTGNRGKPTMDGVYLGDGCQVADCSDTVSSRPENVYTDIPIQAYDQDPPPPFPFLENQVQVFSRTYDDYAACTSSPNAVSCNSNGAVVSGSGNDFFISHAFPINSGTVEDAAGCLTPPCNRNLLTLLGNGTFTNATNTWRMTFTCTAACDDADGNRLNGSVVTVATGAQTRPAAFQLEWRGADWPNAGERNTLVVYQCAVTCATPPLPSVTPYPSPYLPPNPVLMPSSVNTENVYPLMIYVDGDLRICQGCNPAPTFYYLGNAAFLARGTADDTISTDNPSIAIDSDLLACAPPCTAVDHDSFPKKHLFTFYTPGNILMGLVSQRNLMGLFYAGGKWKTTKQTNAVGGLTARVFDVTSQVPSLWQATQFPRIQVAFPPRAQRWTISTVRWKECLGAVPTSPC